MGNLRAEEQRLMYNYPLELLDWIYGPCNDIWLQVAVPCAAALVAMIMIPMERPLAELLRRFCPCRGGKHAQGVLYDVLVKARRAEGRMASYNPRAHEDYASAFKLIDLTAAQQDHDRHSSSSSSSDVSSTTEEEEEEEEGWFGALFGHQKSEKAEKKKKKKEGKKEKKEKNQKYDEDGTPIEREPEE